MTFEELQQAVREAAAIRRRQRLQPAGGQGDKIFPPTYPGDNNVATHVFERRRMDGEEKTCVLIDSVQSQANRMEEALLAAAEAGRIPVPRLVVDFPGAGLNSVGAISSLDAPHRIFDAILRDSEIAGQRFGDSDLGKALKQATARDASAILQASPTSLLFGVWNSTGEGGGLGAKFARAIVSEIIGVDVPVVEVADRRTGEVALRTAGRRTGSRIDPLGISKDVPIYTHKDSDSDWTHDPADAKGGPKKPELFKGRKGSHGEAGSAAKINHGNIPPSVAALGVTCDHALQTLVITLAGLRRLRFGGGAERDEAARTYLAALGLVAALEADRQGHALRSRCDLVCDGHAPLELIGFDGSATEIALDADTAVELHQRAFDAAVDAKFQLKPEPVILTPQKKLVAIVEKSQTKALSDEAEASD